MNTYITFKNGSCRDNLLKKIDGSFKKQKKSILYVIICYTGTYTNLSKSNHLYIIILHNQKNKLNKKKSRRKNKVIICLCNYS